MQNEMVSNWQTPSLPRTKNKTEYSRRKTDALIYAKGAGMGLEPLGRAIGDF